MSAPVQTPGRAEQTAHRRSRRERARAGGLIVLAVAIALFAVLNVDEVKVHYLLGTGEAPLIIVIVISLLVGIVLTQFAERRAARRR
jgi:uncharacterized integral membrane protein